MSSPPIVLVVDDEISMRRAMAAILGRSFKVVAFESGADAITYANTHLHEIFAAFIDHGMEGMDGNQLCHALHSIDPAISLVGFTGNESAIFNAPLFSRLLKKQLSPESVMALTEQAVRAAAILRTSNSGSRESLPLNPR